jgi:DGQHR domain-containing protein
MKIDPSMEPELTPPAVFLRGEFSLWKYSIPYFSTVMSLAFVAKQFSLIEDIPEAERLEWSIEELFQRDISWHRIEEELVKYLKNENQAQFFNSLTIALLPRHGQGFGGTYEVKKSYSAIADPGLDEPLQIGGIQLQYYKGTLGAGKLRWDVDEIIGVAVDGQHRLAAIKAVSMYFKPEQLQKSHVPILLLIPHKTVGFIEPPFADGKSQPASTLRRIFIDLNKNARPVTRTRNILLDDQDVISVCTRSLIAQRLSEKPEDHRLPLAAVDWISENKNKFEQGPFVTNILLLHDIVDRLIEMPKMEEWDEDDVDKIRKRFIDKFQPNEQQLEDLMSQVQRCYNQELPLSFLPAEIAIFQILFNKEWAPYLYRLYSELSPYRQLLVYGKEHGLHKPQFFNLYANREIFSGDQAEKHAALIKNTIIQDDPKWNENNNYVQPLKYIDEVIKDDSWAFKVVFQKALFRSFLALCEQDAEFFPDVDDRFERRDKFTTRWIEAVNSLFEKGLGVVDFTFSRPAEKFWLGIGLRGEDIDFTAAATNRIARWLDAWVCLYCLGDEVPTWSALEKDHDNKLITIVDNALRVKAIKEGMKKVVLLLPGSEELNVEEEVINRIKKRYDFMAKLAKELAQG